MARSKVALEVYNHFSGEFDHVIFVGPATWIAKSPEQRYRLLVDEVLSLCHYKTERKLLVVNQVELFGGNEILQREF